MAPKVEPVLLGRNLSKRFGRTLAVEGVTLALFAGEVLGVVGGNGSGKSTLMNILSGMMVPDGGQVILRGKEVTFKHPTDAIGMGISILSQFPELYWGLDVLENIFIGQELIFKSSILRLLDRHTMKEQATILLQKVGAPDIRLEQSAGTLSGGQQKAVAMARLFARHADILIFDEPNASLGISQKERTLKLISDFKAAGKVPVLITHDLDEIQSTCDRVVVMSRGSIVADEVVQGLSRERLSEYIVKS